MNTNTKPAVGTAWLRKALLSGAAALLLLLMGATDALAQSYLSAADAKVALKTEIVSLMNADEASYSATAKDFQLHEQRIEFYNAVYDQIKYGNAVSASVEAAYNEFFGVTGDFEVSDRARAYGKDFRQDVTEVITN